MKLSEQWLREWVNPQSKREELCEMLTMAGLEVEEMIPVDESAPIEGQDVDILDIAITPNRGDCLSIKGLAREISALTEVPIKEVKISQNKISLSEAPSVTVDAKEACPHYLARIIRNIKADVTTPIWMKERLRRGGIRSINPVVDVTNYVMLELGQPMHAFDLNKIKEKIQVRYARDGEEIILLDGSEKKLDKETLVIADNKNPIALGGVMGGMDSSVTLLTTDILLEGAYFSPQTVARQRQYYALNSDSAYRYERGVDPTLQRDAMERATQLILEIAGGKAGEITEVSSTEYLPKKITIELNKEKVDAVLGMNIPAQTIESFLKRIGCKIKKTLFNKDKWEVEIPSHRFDLILPEDLIEEIARLYGYDKIPTHELKGKLHVSHAEENAKDNYLLKRILSDLGYYEIVSYSFVAKKLQSLLDPGKDYYELVNPINAEMAVMRTNLWPGLLNTLLYNTSRQQHQIRIFEMGLSFNKKANDIIQSSTLAGLIAGLAEPEQWGEKSRNIDFFDLKGDLENFLYLAGMTDKIDFKPATHPALHPTQTAEILYQNQKIGLLGALHPSIAQSLDISNKVFLFELDTTNLLEPPLPRAKEISKFPEVRRDIAITVNQAVPAKEIQDTIQGITGDWLKDVFIFDVYQGKGISPGLKSVALGLVLQHPTRTLVDDEVAKLMEQVISALKRQLGAELRS